MQTTVPQDKEDERIIMKIQGALIDILCNMSPEIYEPYVIFEKNNGQKILYVRILKDLYRMLSASLLYYKKFRKDIESIGFEVNPYDAYVANRIINGKQHTVAWNVDDLK